MDTMTSSKALLVSIERHDPAFITLVAETEDCVEADISAANPEVEPTEDSTEGAKAAETEDGWAEDGAESVATGALGVEPNKDGVADSFMISMTESGSDDESDASDRDCQYAQSVRPRDMARQ